MDDRPELVAAYLGAIKAGAVAIPDCDGLDRMVLFTAGGGARSPIGPARPQIRGQRNYGDSTLNSSN
ncbi:MAG: hypothetical protein QF827_02515 [Alphaproteobacteria bacterium]|nr:hypothetical protein [Alphaproteobacteria bacterium]